MNAGNLRKIVVMLVFTFSLSAFYFLNTTGRDQAMTTFENYNFEDSTKIHHDTKKLATKTDTLKKSNSANKNGSVLIQDVEIMKIIIQIGKESLPVLSIKDYVPFLK